MRTRHLYWILSHRPYFCSVYCSFLILGGRPQGACSSSHNCPGYAPVCRHVFVTIVIITFVKMIIIQWSSCLLPVMTITLIVLIFLVVILISTVARPLLIIPLPVEGLYCKRPIQCLASSELLTPHPLTARRVCIPPAFGAGGGHILWVERGWRVNSSEDARHCSVLYRCKYFVPLPIYDHHCFRYDLHMQITS